MVQHKSTCYSSQGPKFQPHHIPHDSQPPVTSAARGKLLASSTPALIFNIPKHKQRHTYLTTYTLEQ